MEVRTRFAPSPTGFLHVGGVRTALYNYLFAKANGGKFILRIEDTDQERSTKESLEQILDSLEWLHLQWHEGPSTKSIKGGGNNGPYFQSERLKIYSKYTSQLLQEKKAYRCFCSTQVLEKKKKENMSKGLQPVYDRTCLTLSQEQINNNLQENKPYVVRLNTKENKEIRVNDLILGESVFDPAIYGDFIIQKSDGFPSYNYAVVIDDYTMKISHVIRGVGHLANTSRQIQVYNAFNWQEPKWAHISEIVGSDHKKLSKRRGATSVTDFRELGYDYEAINNYLALLGWSSPSGEEKISMKQLESEFDLSRCIKSSAMFDVFDLSKLGDEPLSEVAKNELSKYLNPTSKLNWLSNLYIREKDETVYIEEIQPFVDTLPFIGTESDKEILNSRLLALRVYLNNYAEVGDLLKDFHLDIEDFKPDASTEQYLSAEFTLKLLEHLYDSLSKVESWQESPIKEAIKEAGKRAEVKGKNLFMTVRSAVTGKTSGMDLALYSSLLGKNLVLARITKLIQK